MKREREKKKRANANASTDSKRQKSKRKTQGQQLPILINKIGAIKKDIISFSDWSKLYGCATAENILLELSLFCIIILNF